MIARNNRNKTCFLLLSVLLVTQAPIWIAYLSGADLLIDYLYGWLSILLMIFLSLSASVVFSEYASFDKTFLPAKKKYYFIIPLQALLLLVVSIFVGHLIHKTGFSLPSKFGSVSTKLVYYGFFFSIVIVPIVEEIFWRGYMLDQLRKFLHLWIALFLQAILFSVSHIPAKGVYCISIFFVGLAFGYWRIRYRALLPLIMTHSVMNTLVYLPMMADLVTNSK